jgi:hypothetical protein
VRLEFVMTEFPVGFTTTSTGTCDPVRVVDVRVNGGELVDVAVLAKAQYPARRLPGPRTTTCPGTFAPPVAM